MPKKKETTQSELETLRDIIAPSALEVTSNYIKIGTKYAKTVFIFTYPKYLASNWFSPIINMGQPMDVSFFIHPYRTEKVMKTGTNNLHYRRNDGARRKGIDTGSYAGGGPPEH